jgi:hypothetical protein
MPSLNLALRLGMIGCPPDNNGDFATLANLVHHQPAVHHQILPRNAARQRAQ